MISRVPVLLLGLILAAAAIPAARGMAQAPQPPNGPGKAEFIRACTACHAAGMAIAQRHTPSEWTEVIARMQVKGMQASAQDLRAVHAYLVANYGKAAADARRPPPPRPAPGRLERPAGAPKPAPVRGAMADQWPVYGQNNASQNFSPLVQLTPQNVARLQPAWTYHYGAGVSDLGDAGIDYRFQVQPLIVGGRDVHLDAGVAARPGPEGHDHRPGA
ncbi:cytochrome c [Phenylobacterium sp. J367]|uniref:c-type cytochrome n=1 Tax=Phenylobacterium sp. J367 TaxID=2898435 RepID=UPI002150ABF9|nr:hypothetical protein [Phenylobacterium sp. J367]MCR5879292.1 hypothetical protein [Phenylobacterium sp. J367]